VPAPHDQLLSITNYEQAQEIHSWDVGEYAGADLRYFRSAYLMGGRCGVFEIRNKDWMSAVLHNSLQC